jgi:hypothetical protein
MASVRFSKRPNRGRQQRYEATFDPKGKGLKQYPQSTGREQLDARQGIPGFYPQGTDTRTPGFPRERKRTSTRGYTQR